MDHRDHNQNVAVPPEWLPFRDGSIPPFHGFERPNTVYVPNQFFDVCLPYASLGAARVVAFMIRQILGWCDDDGKPLREQIGVSYRDLIAKAGLSRRLIKPALDEAVAAKFIRCVRQAKSKKTGQSASTAAYELRWSKGKDYIKDPKEFDGFFSGDGHRTDIPNGFFDHLVPREPLSVIKIVGSVLRFTIGFKVERGGRRQQVALSYRAIQRYARISDPNTLSAAIKHSLDTGYLLRVKSGRFDPKGKSLGVAATYAVKWCEANSYGSIGSQTIAKNLPDRFTNHSDIGSQTIAKDRFTNHSIEMTLTNDTLKQHQADRNGSLRLQVPDNGTAVVEGVGVYELLRREGFNDKTASMIAATFSPDLIDSQIRWLSQRMPSRNRLGMLRRAIEENWPEPAEQKLSSTKVSSGSHGLDFARHFYAGLGDNKGEPTAEPGAAEVGLAERFVSRLLEVIPDQERVAAWGRSFGQFVRDRRTTSRQTINSLVLGHRLLGDEFFAQQTSAYRRHAAEARQAAWAKHQQDFKVEWLRYLAETENQFKSDRPADYGRFVNYRDADREKISRSGMKSFADSILRYFDSDEGRLMEFQKFFAGDVLDFLAWDQQVNPKGFPASPTRS